MVEIRYPPPTRNITPQYCELKAGTTIQRIFDPTSYEAAASKFRYFGPLSRFDHQIPEDKPKLSKDRGIIYAGLSMSCCLIEVFGDHEVIKINRQQIAYITLKQSLKLLDLRGSGAWNAGGTAAMAVDSRRRLTQAWSRYFYQEKDLYGDIEGIIFNNAHDSQAALALYERAANQLSSASISILNLNEPAMRESILKVSNQLNLLVEIEV